MPRTDIAPAPHRPDPSSWTDDRLTLAVPGTSFTAETVLETATGWLRTPDFVVTIIDAFAPAKAAAAS